MKILKSIYRFYIDGFKNMTIGKTLWKVVALKILAFLFAIYLVTHFLYNSPIKDKNKSQKADFVSKTLILGGNK